MKLVQSGYYLVETHFERAKTRQNDTIYEAIVIVLEEIMKVQGTRNGQIGFSLQCYQLYMKTDVQIIH